MDKLFLLCLTTTNISNLSPFMNSFYAFSGLNYITALESLLLPNNEGELSYRLSLYASYILSSKKDIRLIIFMKLKAFYDIRSKIIHSGVYEIEDDELKTLKHYSKTIILSILNDKKRKFVDSKNIQEFDSKLKSLVME